jgi:DNA polymerase-4
MPARRVIAHLDCDSFYASVELLRHPELRGRPVVVAGSGPRAVVTTASYEARRFGVHSAMPASQARPLAVLSELVGELRARTGISVSVGVGPSRLVAKTASDWRKPGCFAVLSREQACEQFASSPTRILQGIGPKTAERLAALGIETVGALQQASQERLIERFGERAGRWLKARAWFHDESELETERVLKSRSSEITFDVDVADLRALEQTLRRLSAEVCEGLRRRGISGRTIAIKLRYGDWTNVTRARTLPVATNDPERVAELALSLLRDHAPSRPVRLLGVRVASLQSVAGEHAGESAPQLRLSL